MIDNNNTAAVKAVIDDLSEYTIGRTTYIVKLVFNPASKESLPEILQRLINRECEDLLGESGQGTEKQAV